MLTWGATGFELGMFHLRVSSLCKWQSLCPCNPPHKIPAGGANGLDRFESICFPQVEDSEAKSQRPGILTLEDHMPVLLD